jgi:hypothetical protein
MKDRVNRLLFGRSAALGAVALAVGVAAAACNGSTPGGLSPTAGIVSSSAVEVSEGNCSIAGATKDESAPFFLAGVNTLFIKAGNNCFGPINADNQDDANLACFNITFTDAGVSVSGVGGQACRGLGLSHIEGIVVEEPPCEGKECEPPPPPCEGKECPPPPCEGKECEV